MSIFDFFRNSNKTASESNKPEIKFGFRGEDITYRLRGKEIYISFTWGNGDRIYPDSIENWNDGSALTDNEKKRIFHEILHFVKEKKGKTPIVVINTDDAFKKFWEHTCSINQPVIDSIEYTSDEENYQFERNMYLDSLKNGGSVTFGETEVRDEKDLDEAMQKFRKRRAE